MEACGIVVVMLACAVNDEEGEHRSEIRKGMKWSRAMVPVFEHKVPLKASSGVEDVLKLGGGASKGVPNHVCYILLSIYLQQMTETCGSHKYNLSSHSQGA